MGKRTQHFDIKYFYRANLISKDQVQVEYFSTDVMIGYYMPKTLVGSNFTNFREKIMNLRVSK